MDMILFTNMYRTNPDGKLMNNTVMIIGISIIILCCMGSPAVGVIFCCNKNDAPINKVSMGRPVLTTYHAPKEASIPPQLMRYSTAKSSG